MRKGLVVILVVGLLIALPAAALAYGGFRDNLPWNHCRQGLISEENQEEAGAIIEEYREKMAALRQRFQEARDLGDRETLEALRKERWSLMEEKREALAPLVPEEYREAFLEGGPRRGKGGCHGAGEGSGRMGFGRQGFKSNLNGNSNGSM